MLNVSGFFNILKLNTNSRGRVENLKSKCKQVQKKQQRTNSFTLVKGYMTVPSVTLPASQ